MIIKEKIKVFSHLYGDRKSYNIMNLYEKYNTKYLVHNLYIPAINNFEGFRRLCFLKGIDDGCLVFLFSIEDVDSYLEVIRTHISQNYEYVDRERIKGYFNVS